MKDFFQTVKHEFICRKEAVIIRQKILEVFLLLNFSRFLHFWRARRKRELKRHDTNNDSGYRLFLSRECEVMLRQWIVYCDSSQKGPSGVIFASAKKSGERNASNSNWNFEESAMKPYTGGSKIQSCLKTRKEQTKRKSNTPCFGNKGGCSEYTPRMLFEKSEWSTVVLFFPYHLSVLQIKVKHRFPRRWGNCLIGNIGHVAVFYKWCARRRPLHCRIAVMSNLSLHSQARTPVQYYILFRFMNCFKRKLNNIVFKW